MATRVGLSNVWLSPLSRLPPPKKNSLPSLFSPYSEVKSLIINTVLMPRQIRPKLGNQPIGGPRGQKVGDRSVWSRFRDARFRAAQFRVAQYGTAPNGPHGCCAYGHRGHIGWNTSKIIARPNSLRSLLTWTSTWAIWCNGNTPKN